MAFFTKRPKDKDGGERPAADRAASLPAKPNVPPDVKKPAPAPEPKKPAAPVTKPESRLVSLDAYRGFIMLMMASGAFGLAKIVKEKKLEEAGVVAGSFFDRAFRFLAWQFDHVPWQGGVVWDLIQPAFMFMVGVALPYSFSRRAAVGESYLVRFGHALFRSLVLILLAVFLSTGSEHKQPHFIFVNVLAQIGLGYPFLFLFVNRPAWLQWGAIALICGGMWYAFFQHPLPPEGFDYATVGIAADDPHRDDFVPAGLNQHWAKHTNFAEAMDHYILNWFPREKPFERNAGGYATLNFVTALATMLLGLIVGEMLRSNRTEKQKLQWLGAVGGICLVLGLALGFTVNPIVKRIWTPSWMLASGACVVWMLAAFYWLFDVRGWKRLAWPLAVVGMNSIVMYMLAQLMKGWTARTLKLHFGQAYQVGAEWLNAHVGWSLGTELFGGPFGDFYQSLAVLFCFWLVCVWLYRQKIFVRI
jgi:heparan-alpha-glucosaminide N-acetyltransferase